MTFMWVVFWSVMTVAFLFVIAVVAAAIRLMWLLEQDMRKTGGGWK